MLLIIEALLFLAALRQDHRAAAEETVYPLDMAPDSVDDRYYGCEKIMADLVNKKYLAMEKNNSPNFKAAWIIADKKTSKLNIFSKLSTQHKIAIKVCADDNVRSEFSHDTRTGRQSYKDNTYKWYSLHFLLTEAIQILKKKENKCFDTFRGTNDKFDYQSGEVGFGSFASSSLNRERAKRFGRVSCFEIHTCEGAEVTKYSRYPDEKEVLIPPYEKFNVVVKTKTDDPNLWCETVYILKNSGIRNELNCAHTQ
ncbi:NAD(P)(+)--arginine ADP-ribosyltransferase 2 [Anabarilius grahami]|uniref:NAD(P)(+)--arginine ADP-ribosyltransferase n=1 Tax=Anabarilius grahami TaxID=495550 RepID=A0A3N0Y8F2_ANAGA|nr:NAD(P)(+)--arginine ADP-ribosyltransferase 2 [Anabarilius grahami]